MSFRSAVKGLSRRPLDLGAFVGSLEAIREVDDRSAALLSSSLLDAALQELIVHALKCPDNDVYEPLFGLRGALHDFNPRIWVGCALRLYGSNTRKDLGAICAIRNAFAHTAAPITFQTQEISDYCGTLTLATRASTANHDATLGIPTWPPTTVREQFTSTCLAYWNAFMELACGETQPWRLD